MRSRNALVLLLLAGMLTCMSGTALAVTGVAGSGSAGVAQYTNGEGTAPSGDEGGIAPSGDEGAPSEDGNEVLGAPNPGAANVADPANVADQESQIAAAQGSTELPFTGFLLIPLFLGGVALLAGGLVLRGKVSAARPA